MESFSTVDAIMIIGIFITLGLMSGKDAYDKKYKNENEL